MKDLVVIKSFPNGISLRLNSEVAFGQLLDEVGTKFSDAKAFFGNGSMALSIEGRELSGEEELLLLERIRENSDVKILCIVAKDEEVDKIYLKAITQVEKMIQEKAVVQFFKGDITNGDVLETEDSVVVLGNVDPGSAVISPKSIIILGGLYGEAYAGENKEEGAFVAALEMEPERIKIGDFKYKAPTKQKKWGARSKKAQPKIAFVKDESIVFETLTKEMLGTF